MLDLEQFIGHNYIEWVTGSKRLKMLSNHIDEYLPNVTFKDYCTTDMKLTNLFLIPDWLNNINEPIEIAKSDFAQMNNPGAKISHDLKNTEIKNGLSEFKHVDAVSQKTEHETIMD